MACPAARAVLEERAIDSTLSAGSIMMVARISSCPIGGAVCGRPSPV
jgi:hypothetical protein